MVIEKGNNLSRCQVKAFYTRLRKDGRATQKVVDFRTNQRNGRPRYYEQSMRLIAVDLEEREVYEIPNNGKVQKILKSSVIRTCNRVL